MTQPPVPQTKLPTAPLKPAPPKKTYENTQERIEGAVTNFTQLPSELIAAAIRVLSGESLIQPQNYTDLNSPEMKKKLEESGDKQDNKAGKLAAIRRQLQYMQGEAAQARSYLDRQEQNRIQGMEQEEQVKKQEKNKPQQPLETSQKQARGQLFGGKKPKKSLETNASSGKN